MKFNLENILYKIINIQLTIGIHIYIYLIIFLNVPTMLCPQNLQYIDGPHIA